MPGGLRGGGGLLERIARRGGGVWGRALGIALPLMLAESIDSILWIVDTYFVSGLGYEAVGAVGLGGYLSWLMFVWGSLFYMGGLVVVSQLVGGGRLGEAGRAVGEAISSNAALSAPLALAAWLAAPGLVAVVGGPKVSGATAAMAVEYFRARLLGLPFLYAGLALDAGFRASGVTRPVLAATAASAAANAVLDPVLIYGLLGAPALGVAGAGYASAAASAVYLAALYALSGALPFAPAPRPPGRLALVEARVGLPALAERLAFVTGNLAYLGAVARCGDAALAAHTIGVRLESLAFLPLYSIGEASAALAGQEVGAGRIQEAKRAGLEVAKLNTLAGLAAALLLAALSPIAPHAFTEDPRVASLAETYLLIAAATEPAFAASIALTMAIRGAGNTLVPTIVNLASLYALRVLPASVLPRYMPPGKCVLGAWIPMAIDVAGRSLASYAVYTRYFHRLARRVA